MTTEKWGRKDGGWIRGDGKYRLVRTPNLPPSRQDKWYAEVKQGGKWFVLKDKRGRNTRTWGQWANAMGAIDKAFPVGAGKEFMVGQTDYWKFETELGSWVRVDRRFLIMRSDDGKVVRHFVKENVGGNEDNWTTLKTGRGNIRGWDEIDGAMKAIDKEFPMNSGPKEPLAPPAPPRPPEKTRVTMNFVFECNTADATRMISEFLSEKNISNLDLKVEGYEHNSGSIPRGRLS